MSTNKFFLLCLFYLLVALPAHSQNRPVHEIHSMMIYNFIKYIQWPDHTEGDFVIGVVGDDNVFNTLKVWYGDKVRGNKKFSIKKFDSAADIGDCHILYVGTNESRAFDSIKSKVAGSSTLIITDKPGLGERGSSINFKTVNNKLAFELNQQAIEKSRLKVSGQLASMAILI